MARRRRPLKTEQLECFSCPFPDDCHHHNSSCPLRIQVIAQRLDREHNRTSTDRPAVTAVTAEHSDPPPKELS